MVTVRRLTPNDAPACTDLAAEMHANSKFASLPFSHNKMLWLFADGLQRDFAVGYVAVDDRSDVIGMIGVYETPYFFGYAKLVQDYGLYVKPARRSLPVAKQLVAAVETWARERGATAILMGVSAPVDTEATGKFYQYIGYKPWAQLYRKEL